MDYVSKSLKELLEAKKDAMLNWEIDPYNSEDKIQEVNDEMGILLAAEEFYIELRNEIFETTENERLHIIMASKVSDFKYIVKRYFYYDKSAPYNVAKEFIKIVKTYELLAFNEEEVTPNDILKPSPSLTISPKIK